MRTDLYGDSLPTQYDTDATRQAELFGAMGTTTSAWMRAVEVWAHEREAIILQWRVDQRFSIDQEGAEVWYAVVWDADRARWTISQKII